MHLEIKECIFTPLHIAGEIPAVIRYGRKVIKNHRKQTVVAPYGDHYIVIQDDLHKK